MTVTGQGYLGNNLRIIRTYKFKMQLFVVNVRRTGNSEQHARIHQMREGLEKSVLPDQETSSHNCTRKRKQAQRQQGNNYCSHSCLRTIITMNRTRIAGPSLALGTNISKSCFVHVITAVYMKRLGMVEGDCNRKIFF